MSSHSDKLKKLVVKLSQKTANGEMEWKVSVSGESVSAKLDSGTIIIEPSTDETGQDAVRVGILDEAGEQKISFDDTSVIAWDTDGRRFSYYTFMKSLLDDAIRSASGENKLLTSVLTELGVDDDDVPF